MTTIEAFVLSIVEGGPTRVGDLLRLVRKADAEPIRAAVRNLVDEGAVEFDLQMRLRAKRK